MKRIIAIIMTIALIMGLGIVTAVAAPSYNGFVEGVIQKNGAIMTGSFSGDYKLQFEGEIYEQAGHIAKFHGKLSGDIEGAIKGAVNSHGLDSLYAIIAPDDGASEDVRLIGSFLQSGVDGDFAGQIITGPLPKPVEYMAIGGPDTVAVGNSLQLKIKTDPESSEPILWSVLVDDREKAKIDQNGVLTGLQDGEVTVIANILDQSLMSVKKSITVVAPETEVAASVEPSYIIVIPPAVNFGTLQKDSGVKAHTFPVEAKEVMIESGRAINVGVGSDFAMSNGGGGSLKYRLYNSGGWVTDGLFTAFTDDRVENGVIRVNTNDITQAGSYAGVMTFKISYE